VFELASITAALIAAALLAIWFNTTRWISITAFAALCLLYPWLVGLVIVGVAWAFLHFKVRNHRRKP
jgi:ABC-type sugar transport system permease subunit